VLLIDCPWCGKRNHDEFTYLGDATVTRPAEADPDDAKLKTEQAWMDYVYNRDNPRGDHWEYWQHVAGCRAWIKVHRNTLTHEIKQTVVAFKGRG
jgi:heterotetrameric sarcosine oxidase delta subunit